VTTTTAAEAPAVVATRLRHVLIGLGVAVEVGTLLELAALRHWEDELQFVAWGGAALLAAALVLVVGDPSAGRVRAARVLAGLVALSGVAGMVVHVISNLDAGPLDKDYGERWDTMSALGQWWAAASGGVGPSPALASGVLIVGAVCVLGATIGRGDGRGVASTAP